MNKTGFATRLLAVALLALLPLTSLAASLTVDFNNPPATDVWLLAHGQTAVPLLVETNSPPAVLRAANDLAQDIARVTGKSPTVENTPAATSANLVIIGTLGQSPLLDRLAAAGKLATKGVAGQWESYVLQLVDHPLPGVDRALVIAGSDRRGTIFGIYDLSARIGVSPWYWWADVPVTHRDSVALRGDLFQQGPPAVKYRGIFLNDEDWGLRPWATQTLEPENGNIGPKTYAHLFELLLRLHANYLWPAMHPGTLAFNHFPENKKIADAYGIVMGSSHCEQMLCDNVSEWDEKKYGDYNFVTNPSGVLKYWAQRVHDNGAYENIYTVGMRGIHDGGMPGGGTTREKAARLHDIISHQRDLLTQGVNSDVARVPQIFCPYKEVLELYRLAPNIPDDITLVWPDDNYGYVRQFSSPAERARSGGGGVYYHISYWGAPYDYLWLDTTAPALIAEEMTKAYAYGANRVWILNVGDLKPGEIGAEFFLNLGWNPSAWNGVNTDEMLTRQFTRDFGPELAPEIVSILDEYYRLNFSRKPEHMGIDPKNRFLKQSPFSSTLNGDETLRRVVAWRTLVNRVAALVNHVPVPARDAFFEFIGYPVRTACAANVKALAIANFDAANAQGRIMNPEWNQIAGQAQTKIDTLTKAYNETLAAGKWRGMMSAQPRKLATFNPPSLPPQPDYPWCPARLGVVVEGTPTAHLASDTNTPCPALPEFTYPLSPTAFVDVFNAGTAPMKWSVESDEPWIHFTPASGAADARVQVTIDWAHAPQTGEAHGTLHIFAPGQNHLIPVNIFHAATADIVANTDFMESANRVILQATHVSQAIPGRDAQWRAIPGLGYNGAAMSVFPVTTAVRTEPAKIIAESPCLTYRLWLRHPGDWSVTLRTLPTFSVETGQPQRYAIAFDDAPPQIVALPTSLSENDPKWQENVLRNAALTTSHHNITQPGAHTLKIRMVDPGLVLDAIAAENHPAQPLGYTWPDETRIAITTAAK